MPRSPQEIAACAVRVESLLRGSPSPESIESACALVDSMLPDLADAELIDVARRFRAVAAQVGCRTAAGVIPPARLYDLAQRLTIVAEAALRRQKTTAWSAPAPP